MDKYESKNSTSEEPPKETPKGPNGKQLVTSVTTTDHEKIEGEDKLGNPVTVPGNFKVVEGETVEDGIVIEDSEGNQFVWIPVSNTDGDNNADTDPTATDLIKLKDNTKVEITLGRYKFSTTDGTTTPKQTGARHGESSATTTIDGKYYENTNTEDGRPNGGVGAKNLAEFVTSVENNHGYYIGRYEASFGSGNSTENYKPQVKVSTGNSTSSMNKSSGILWNFITQGEASKVCQNMYNAEDRDIESDLVNSYAWDTAIVYIQAMKDENKNYANANGGTNTSLKNTGDTGDEKCHIYDMAGNLEEWTTEYSTSGSSSHDYPCVYRGGSYNLSYDCTAVRSYGDTADSYSYIGFRPLLYLK